MRSRPRASGHCPRRARRCARSKRVRVENAHAAAFIAAASASSTVVRSRTTLPRR